MHGKEVKGNDKHPIAMTSYITCQAYRSCVPMMSELLVGSEILDALSVLGDIPDYLSDMVNGHADWDTPSNCSSPQVSNTSTDQDNNAGGGTSSCYPPSRVTHMSERQSGTRLHMPSCPQQEGASTTGIATRCPALGPVSYHHSQTISLPLPYSSTDTAHNVQHNSYRSTLDSQSPMDMDQTAIYRAELSNYWNGENENDSCSYYRNAQATLPNTPRHTPDNLHVATFNNTLHIKQETPKPCAYSANIPEFIDINNSFSQERNASRHSYHQVQSKATLSVITTQVITKYPNPDSPQSATSSMDGSEGEDENTVIDGETTPRPENHVKIKGVKSDRRLRRREQNRQAARRCRQRKKEQSQELVKEYYQLLTANSEMQSKLKSLETEKQRLLDIYEDHLVMCSLHLVKTTSC